MRGQRALGGELFVALLALERYDWATRGVDPLVAYLGRDKKQMLVLN